MMIRLLCLSLCASPVLVVAFHQHVGGGHHVLKEHHHLRKNDNNNHDHHLAYPHQSQQVALSPMSVTRSCTRIACSSSSISCSSRRSLVNTRSTSRIDTTADQRCFTADALATRCTTTALGSTSSSNDNNSNNDVVTSTVEKLLQKFDLSSISTNADSIRKNILQGDMGSRGEVYFFTQLALMVFIVLGNIPMIGDALLVLFGPGLMFVGGITVLLSITEMGTALSPWPVPAKDNTILLREGLYGQVRHPMYAGIMCLCLGLSIFTGSALRLLLTLVLVYVLHIKANFEEQQLEQVFTSDYTQYKQNVPGQFFPHDLLARMPWNKE